MKAKQKRELLERSKTFFIEKIARNHITNTLKLAKLSEFTINPFLDRYLAQFLTGRRDSYALAQALILPRVLGTSITGSFGTQMQTFCGEVLQAGFGTAHDGMDLEFIDTVDSRRKFCQVKAGPRTINKDDIATIVGKFGAIQRRARFNRADLRATDLVVGVLYGTEAELSSMYRSLAEKENITIFVGKEFWRRLTGDEDFYADLIQAFADSVIEIDATKVLEEVTQQLSLEIEKRDAANR